MSQINVREEVVIKFAGDSGDGIQLTGTQFTNNTALLGADLSTFPDFPAEIRAPQGTLAGVSGFQLRFSSQDIFTPGDECDVLVAMNAAALKVNLPALKKGGIIIANTDGFDAKNLRLSHYEENPLENDSLVHYEVHPLDITQLTRKALEEYPLGTKEKDRAKNMYTLGYLYWMYHRDMQGTIDFLTSKFSKTPEIMNANIRALKSGYNYGETVETYNARYEVKKAKLPPGVYRGVNGNTALSYGLMMAAQKAGLKLFLGSYPITPASDILHELSKHKNFDVITFQAEDEIAGIGSAIGASYGGSLGVTTTSGPGMALKGEAMGLAVMLEIPLVIVDVQRGGPSTGLPTKTEQSDLLQAVYGRNGESPIPVIAASSPVDCFYRAFEACKLAIEHMTPVILLSDGYIANGSEPWKFPNMEEMEVIHPRFAPPREEQTEDFMPYERNEYLVRSWAIPGTKGNEHRVGGLEKQDLTGQVSYDPANHEFMVKTRAEKVRMLEKFIPPCEILQGPANADILVLGWGSTYGVIRSVVRDLLSEGFSVSQVHLHHIHPFPANLGEILKSAGKIIIPEINNGQLIQLIRSRYLVDALPFNKIQGVPIQQKELKEFIKSL